MTIAKTANEIAETLRNRGFSVEITHWGGTGGQSSYIKATILNGRKFAKFGIRVSDHGVGAHRTDLDDDIQHYIYGEPTAEQMTKITDMADRAIAAVRS